MIAIFALHWTEGNCQKEFLHSGYRAEQKFSLIWTRFPYDTSVSQFSHSVLSDSLRPHGLHHTRLPCPSPAPRDCSNSCPSSQWCHPIISSSVVPFSSCLQSFPASGAFQMNQFFPSGGQSIGVSASVSVLTMNIQDISFRMDWLDLPAVQGSSPTPQFKSINSLALSFFIVQLSHDYWKNHSFD